MNVGDANCFGDICMGRLRHRRNVSAGVVMQGRRVDARTIRGRGVRLPMPLTHLSETSSRRGIGRGDVRDDALTDWSSFGEWQFGGSDLHRLVDAEPARRRPGPAPEALRRRRRRAWRTVVLGQRIAGRTGVTVMVMTSCSEFHGDGPANWSSAEGQLAVADERVVDLLPALDQALRPPWSQAPETGARTLSATKIYRRGDTVVWRDDVVRPVGRWTVLWRLGLRRLISPTGSSSERMTWLILPSSWCSP